MDGTAFQYEKKCWGECAHVFASDHAAVSHLLVRMGYRCSRHVHKHRANAFNVLSGEILVEEWGPGLRAETIRLIPGRSHTVPSGVLHRFRVVKSGEVIEVYWPDNGGVVRLDDIERLDHGGIDGE